MKRALIVVDLQNDFLPGGALPVPGGEEVIPVVNRLLAGAYDVRIATKDWHPVNHRSFTKNGGTWPVHCVAFSKGSDLAPGFIQSTGGTLHTFGKGQDPKVEQYSGITLDVLAFLRTRGIESVHVCGLALDYCVAETALDAKRNGFDVHVVLPACRAVTPEGGVRAIKELVTAGVTVRGIEDE